MENFIKRILLVTYLTKYNIKEINYSMSFDKFSDYIEDFLSRNIELNDQNIIEMNKFSHEKYEEMLYNGIKFLPITSEKYPKLLKQISTCPPMLYYKGEIHEREYIALVGSRVNSIFAESTINLFLDGLSQINGVVSGLAKGIDTLAHKKSLDLGFKNIAITANSLETIYPTENYKLANSILDNNGAIISELAIGINRGKKSFIERNRIISGISSYVIPIEMNLKSGTMHTIDFCIRQNKHVLYKFISEKEKSLDQYSGLISLKNKKNLKQTIIKDKFNLEQIKTIHKNTNLKLF